MRRLRIPLVLFVLLVFALPGAAREEPRALDSEARAEIEGLLREVFAAERDRDRKKVLEKLREHDPVSAKDLEGFTKLCLELSREGPKSTGGDSRELQSGPVRGTYLVTGDGRGKKGLFIGLHGGGPDAGDARTAQSKWSPAAGKNCICVFPQATRLVHDAWNQEDQEKFVLGIIEEMKRTHTIDTNRIYMAGHSMGGYGTWSIGGHHADLFAAVSPNSGGVYGTRELSTGRLSIAQGVLPNFYRLPLRWFHGTDDLQCPIDNDLEAERILLELREKHPDGYDFHFQKVDGIGHGIVREGLGPTIKWLTAKKRDPNPKKLIWEPHRRFKKDFYWLHLPTVSRGVLIVAEIVKKREIRIESSGFLPRLTLLLNDDLIDPRREIVVTWNDTEKFRGTLSPSVSALAESMAARRDPAMVHTHRIDLE